MAEWPVAVRVNKIANGHHDFAPFSGSPDHQKSLVSNRLSLVHRWYT